MVRAALLGAAMLAATVASASAQEHTVFDDVKLEAIPDTHGVDPYPGEMVLLRIRGAYRVQINIQKLLPPDFTNFGWMNLVKDRNFETTFGNFAASGYERTMAIFPQKSGLATIGSFTHHLTVVDGDHGRELDVKSPPVQLNVAKWIGPGGPDDPNQWWLPASDVQVTDEWSSDPNRVPRGETVRRTVTITAAGVTAEQLPPPPVMRSAGIISFRGPNDRETRVTENGPVARAVYRWDMRPISAFPATVEAIKFPWFDTVSRTMRESAIPAQRMAWAVAPGPNGEAAPPLAPRASRAQIAGVGIAAFLVGAAVLLAGAGASSGLPRVPPRALWRLRVARWRRDPAAFRAAITELARHDGRRASDWLGDSQVRSGLAELDRRLYHPGASPMPDLRRLYRTVARTRRALQSSDAAIKSGLAPLDGPARPT